VDHNVITMILGGLVNVGIVLAVAPFFQGVLRKVTARIQSRQGPPIRQPYLDLLKLLGKEDVESGVAPGLQRFAAYLPMAVLLVVACLVPMGFSAPLSGAADGILLVLLLTLGSICTLLAGLAAGSTYSLIGVNREMMAMITLEPLFAVAIVMGAIQKGSFQLDTVLNGAVYGSGMTISGFIMLVVMILAFQAFIGRVPFDMSEAETEIMEGSMIDYSGPKLALFQYASMAKLVVYSALFIAMFVPWGSHLPLPVSFVLFWVKVFVVVLLVTAVAATHARYRIDQAIRYFGAMLAAALVALAVASYGF
jgi:formate hydrogenlyase subunit 4